MLSSPLSAGKLLGYSLSHYAGRADVVCFGLVSGGMEPAYGISKVLGCRIYPLIMERVLHPDDYDTTLGIISQYGQVSLNRKLIRDGNLGKGEIDKEIARTMKSIETLKIYFADYLYTGSLKGMTVIITDDAVASGYSMKTAIETMKYLGAGRIILAIPIGMPNVVSYLAGMADEFHCAMAPIRFWNKDDYFRKNGIVTYRRVKHLVYHANRNCRKKTRQSSVQSRGEVILSGGNVREGVCEFEGSYFIVKRIIPSIGYSGNCIM